MSGPGCHGAIQEQFFVGSQLAVPSFCQPAQLQRPDRDAYEPQDFNSESSEHAADLAILAFVEADLDPGILPAGAKETALGRPQASLVIGPDSVDDRLQQRSIGHKAELDVIRLLQVRVWRSDPRS